jgi:DNA-3-methyladenine glycosylase
VYAWAVKLGPYIRRDFYQRPCLEVAPALVGMILVRRTVAGQVLAGRIVEVEAYLGLGQDPASHAHRGKTTRNQSMFGPPGHLYVYRSYGVHACVNLVCEPAGHAAAVLLRAVVPLLGIEQMRQNRSLAKDAQPRLIAAGPGRLSQAFAIDRSQDGQSTARGQSVALRHPPKELENLPVTGCPRIGISKATHEPYRFCAVDNDYLSKRIPSR